MFVCKWQLIFVPIGSMMLVQSQIYLSLSNVDINTALLIDTACFCFFFQVTGKGSFKLLK